METQLVAVMTTFNRHSLLLLHSFSYFQLVHCIVVNRSLDCRCYATRGHLAMYAANAAEFAWRDRLWRLQTCQPQAELHVLTTY